MDPLPRSFLLTDMSWAEVESHLQRDSRLIVPVGACDQYGPHLPIGCGTLVADTVASTLAREFAVLRAPTLSFGVNLPAARTFAGTAGLHEKTLHRLLNDLLASWEDHGFTEFILLTAHDYDPHIEALASVSGVRGRVRVVEMLGIDFSELLAGPDGPQHGGEVMTSLMLYLHPHKVNLARAVDFPLPDEAARQHRLSRLPLHSPGSIGQPSLATVETGRKLFEHIIDKIGSKVFAAPDEAE